MVIAGFLNHQQDIEVSYVIPWLDPMTSVEITTVVAQGWFNLGKMCLFFRCAATCRRSLYQSWTCASCFMPLAISKLFKWLGGIEVPETICFSSLFYLLMNPMFEEHEVIFETYDFVFSRTCQGSFRKKRNEMSEHVGNIRGHYQDVMHEIHPKTSQKTYLYLGGGFKYSLFSPLFGEDSHLDSCFSRGLKPPTSYPWQQDGSDSKLNSLGVTKKHNFSAAECCSGIRLSFFKGFSMWRVLPRTLRSFEEVFFSF